jgi:hypothetical protein
MVTTTTRDERTWYKCDSCGLLFDVEAHAQEHERYCDAEEPAYIQ